MKFSTQDIEKIVTDHIDLPDYGNDEPKEIINLTDVYFESSEYNNKDYIFKSTDYAVEKTAIDGILNKLKEGKSPVEAAQIDALANLYNDLIETVARCEFKKAFSLGINITDRFSNSQSSMCGKYAARSSLKSRPYAVPSINSPCLIDTLIYRSSANKAALSPMNLILHSLLK